MNPEKRTMLPKMAFTGFASRYREPRIEEGFQDITKVDFKVHSVPHTGACGITGTDVRDRSSKAQTSSGSCGGSTGFLEDLLLTACRTAAPHTHLAVRHRACLRSRPEDLTSPHRSHVRYSKKEHRFKPAVKHGKCGRKSAAGYACHHVMAYIEKVWYHLLAQAAPSPSRVRRAPAPLSLTGVFPYRFPPIYNNRKSLRLSKPVRE